MTHTPGTGHGLTVEAGFDLDDGFAGSLEEQELHGTIAELALEKADALAKLTAANRQIARLAGQLEAGNNHLLAVLARLVAAVMNGSEDPLAEALDVLDAAGLQVPEPTPARHRLMLGVAA